MARKSPTAQPKVLYELSMLSPSAVPSPFGPTHYKNIFVHCTRRNDAAVVALYRSRHPTDQSTFAQCRELDGPLIIE